MAPHSKKSQKKKNKEDKPKIDKSSKKIFKPRRDQNDAPTAKKSEALALQLEDEVPDFPRGRNLSLQILIF